MSYQSNNFQIKTLFGVKTGSNQILSFSVKIKIMIIGILQFEGVVIIWIFRAKFGNEME